MPNGKNSKKVEISYALREPRIDFGLFKSDKKKITVKFDWWVEYVKARSKYEMMHRDLLKKLPVSVHTKVIGYE